jgi:hypothetical protein
VGAALGSALVSVGLLVALIPAASHRTAVVELVRWQRAAPAAEQAPRVGTPEWVAQQIEDRNTGRDSRAEMRMRLFDRRGRPRERALTITTLRGNSGRGDRTLLRFTYPNDIRDTAFLVWEHQDADDERFLFLPALGRVRRIAGEEKQESFVGSDLSYEDIGGRGISDYTWSFTNANATWAAPDGTRVAAWALESRAKDRHAQYPRSVSLVLKDRFVIVHAEAFNSRNERVKVFDVRRLERVDGIWSVMELTVVNEREHTRTELTTTLLKYDIGLTEDDFSRRQLEQPGR